MVRASLPEDDSIRDCRPQSADQGRCQDQVEIGEILSLVPAHDNRKHQGGAQREHTYPEHPQHDFAEQHVEYENSLLDLGQLVEVR